MDKQINITEGGLPVETWVSDNTGQSPNTSGMDNYLLTPEEIKEALENLVIEQPQWDYDNGQFVNGEEYQKATAIQQAVLSKLLATAPDVREKVAEAIHDEWQKWAESLLPELESLTHNHLPYGREVEAGNCGCKTCQRIKRWRGMFVPYSELPENVKEYDRPWAEKIHALYAGAILAAADEANAKWVTALKPFSITVDSPEALAGAVQVLMEESAQSGCAAMESAIHADLAEARREERERIIQVILDTEPDPHTYEGEFEAICGTKTSIIKAIGDME